MAQIHLQGIGLQDAKLGKDIQVGDTLVWNFGYTSQVVGIARETKSFITFLLMSNSDGKIRERRMCKTCMWGIKN